MAFEQNSLRYTMPSSGGLTNTTPGTGHVYKTISLVSGDIGGVGINPGGLLRFGGQTGENITLDVFGIGKFTAGAAVTAGQRLTSVASGYMIAATSGTYVFGRVLDQAVGSGAVGPGFFNFATPYFMTTSS